MDDFEKLTQLLKDANQFRRDGVSQSYIDSEIARLTNGDHLTQQSLSQRVRVLATDPSLVARRRQAAQAQAVAPDMEASTGPLEVAAQGATLGLSPIIGGVVSALGAGQNENPMDAFTQGREAAKSRIDAFSGAHPIQSALEGLGGGIAGIPLMGPLAALSNPLERLFGVAKGVESPGIWNLAKQGAAAGIPAGAIYGAADAPTLRDAPLAALKGAGIGGVLGGGVGAGAGIAVPASEMVGARVRGFLNPQSEATRQMLQRLSQQVGPEARGAFNAAEAVRPGLPMVGDVNPTALDVVTGKAGTREAVGSGIAARQADAGNRLAQDAEQLAGTNIPDAVAASAAGDPAFHAYSKTRYVPLEEANPAIDLTTHPRLAAALENPDVASVYRKVTGEALTRGEADPFIPGLGKRLSQLSPASRFSAEQAGLIPPSPKPSLQALQETRTNLRRMLDNLPAGSPHTRENLQRGLRALNQALVGDGTTAGEIPGLAEADKGWEHAIQIFGGSETRGQPGRIGAFAQGGEAWNKDPRVVRQELDALSPEAQSAYKIGMLDAHRARLQGLHEGANAADVATRSGQQSLEPHLQEVFGSQPAMEDFLRRAETERFFNRTKNTIGGGSKTDPSGQMRQSLFGNSEPGRSRIGMLLDQFRHDAVTVPPDMLAQVGNEALTATGSKAQSVFDALDASRAATAQRGPQMERLARGAGLVSGGGGRKAVGLSEIAALMALLNGGRALTHMVTGHTTDRGY